MQPNLNRTSIGLGKLTPPLPKGKLLPKSLLSPLEYFWATALERSQKNYFYIREMSFYFYSPHTGKTIFFYQSFQKRFPLLQVEHGASLPSLSPLKSQLAWAPSAAMRYARREAHSLLGEVFERGDTRGSQHSAVRWMTGQLVR